MRVLRTRKALLGVGLLIAGVWAGIIPFLGPEFGYEMHSKTSWLWTMDRLYLEVIPAAVIIVGGLILLGGMTRFSARVGAWFALLGGVWLVIGPTISMWWHHGTLAIGPAFGSTFVSGLVWLGYFYAIGALVTLLAAHAIGMLTPHPGLDLAADSEAGAVRRRPRATKATSTTSQRRTARPTRTRSKPEATPKREATE